MQGTENPDKSVHDHSRNGGGINYQNFRLLEKLGIIRVYHDNSWHCVLQCYVKCFCNTVFICICSDLSVQIFACSGGFMAVVNGQVAA